MENEKKRKRAEYKREYRKSDAYKKYQQKYRQSDAYKKYQQKYQQSDAFKKSRQKYRQSKAPSEKFYNSILSILNRKKELLNNIKNNRGQSMRNITPTTIKGLEDDILIYQNYVDNYNKLQLRLKTIEDQAIRQDVEARSLANLAEELGKGHGIPRKEIKPPIHSPALKGGVSLGAD